MWNDNLRMQTLPSHYSSEATRDDIYKKIYNNPAATTIKYDKYSNDILSKDKNKIEAVSNYVKNTKKINSTKNLFYQNGCVYQIYNTYIHQNKAYKMQRDNEMWIQTGHFLGVPAVYQQVWSTLVSHNKKYNSWEDDRNVPNSGFKRTAAFKVSLPGKNYYSVFKDDNNLKNILYSKNGNLSLVIDKLKPYDLSTFLFGVNNQDIVGKYTHRPSEFLKHYLLTPKKYNHSIMRVSPALDRQPGLNSLGYSYVVCYNNRYYIYQYSVDHLKFHKKDSTYNEAPIAIFADIPATDINNNVANYLQGLLFDSFGPNYPLADPVSPDDSTSAPRINHYANRIFDFLKKPSYYQLVNSDNTKNDTFDKYQNVNTNIDFPKNTVFKIFMAGGVAAKHKFSIKKRVWELQINGATKVISVNKNKGYKNERRSQFDFTWDAKTKVAKFTRSFYYFAYLLTIECGQCYSSSLSSTSYGEKSNYILDGKFNHGSNLSSPWDSDTLDHGSSISLYLLFSLTYGVAVDQNMNADTNLIIHNDYSFPTFDPTNRFLPRFYTSNINFSIIFLILFLVLFAVLIIILLVKLIFTINNNSTLNYQKLSISADLKKLTLKK